MSKKAKDWWVMSPKRFGLLLEEVKRRERGRPLKPADLKAIFEKPKTPTTRRN